MSVRGFSTGSGTERYDYNYLDNAPDLSKKVDTKDGYGLSQNDFTDEYKNALDADIDASYLRFCTWNVGYFKDGTHKPTTQEAPATIVAMRKMAGSVNPDIMTAQEYVEMVDDENTVPSNNIFTFKFPHKVNLNANKCFSKLTIKSYETITFTSGSGRPCIAFTVDFGGKEITVINNHASIENPPTYRTADFTQLIAYMRTKEYAILAGDFNVADNTEFDPFVTAGFNLCNGGAFGWFDTWPVWANMWDGFTTDWPCFHLDNIITTSNIIPQFVETVVSSVSDHAPLFAVLKVN